MEHYFYLKTEMQVFIQETSRISLGFFIIIVI